MLDLMNVIERCALPGSIVHADMHVAYNIVFENLQMIHSTVDYFRGFVDTDVHTNTMEGTWSFIKREMMLGNRVEDGMNARLLECIWRRKTMTLSGRPSSLRYAWFIRTNNLAFIVTKNNAAAPSIDLGSEVVIVL